LQDNWDSAVELFQELKANRLSVRPNSVTYNILMSACLARDKPQTVSNRLAVLLSDLVTHSRDAQILFAPNNPATQLAHARLESEILLSSDLTFWHGK
jgi:hypothetical protein